MVRPGRDEQLRRTSRANALFLTMYEYYVSSPCDPQVILILLSPGRPVETKHKYDESLLDRHMGMISLSLKLKATVDWDALEVPDPMDDWPWWP